MVSGWVLSFYLFGNIFTDIRLLNLGPNPKPPQVSAALGPLFQSLSLLIPLEAALQIAAVIVLIFAFRQLRTVDDRFSLPSILAVLIPIGVVLASAAAYPLFNELPTIVALAPTTPGGTPTAAFTSAIVSFFFVFVLLGVGGIVVLVGLIGGQILGVWRLGSKYDETLLKLGAIFVIIPFLNIVAPILMIVGANHAKNRFGLSS